LNNLGYRPEDQEAFWSTVERCPHGEACTRCCWLWMGTRDKYGYGYFRIQAERYRWECRTHRYAYELAHGSILTALHVLHRCDVRACVNPSHLWLGTHQDNMADARQKGRMGMPGIGFHNTKLTEDTVRDIRYLRSVGMPRPLVSAIYQVHPDTITGITHGRKRRNVA
jgi:HNH endonuclease